MKYGERLRIAREHKGLSQDELVKLSGVKQGTISKIERGDQNSSGFDAELSHALGIEAMWLKKGLKEFAPDWLAPGEQKNNNLNRLEGNIDANNKIQIQGQVPLISWVQAGGYNEAIDLYEPGYGEDLVNVTVQVGRHTFALRVVGDSMEPEFYEGEMIVVEPDMQFENGDFVIAKVGNDATSKRITRVDGDWYLKPLNSTYPTKLLGEGHVIGVVREKVKRYR